MLLGFTLGVPYLYYMIITRHTKMFNRISVHSSRVVIEKRKKHQGDVEWDYRVSGSRNRGKSLYSIFEYQFRYMKVRAPVARASHGLVYLSCASIRSRSRFERRMRAC